MVDLMGPCGNSLAVYYYFAGCSGIYKITRFGRLAICFNKCVFCCCDIQPVFALRWGLTNNMLGCGWNRVHMELEWIYFTVSKLYQDLLKKHLKIDTATNQNNYRKNNVLRRYANIPWSYFIFTRNSATPSHLHQRPPESDLSHTKVSTDE